MPIGTPAILPSGLPAARSASTALCGFDRLFRRFDDEGVEHFGGSDIGVEGFGDFNGGEFAGGNAIERMAATPVWSDQSFQAP